MRQRALRVCRQTVSLAIAALFSLSFVALARAQSPMASVNPPKAQSQEFGTHSYIPPANVYVPESSIERPEDTGKFAHTMYVIKSPNGGPVQGTPKPDATAENPGSLACVYGLISSYAGCTPAGGVGKHVAKTGGWGAIALVDAYDNPDAATDYETFAKKYSLPTTGFTVAYANSTNAPGASCSGTPAANTDWSVESSLDIEYAHAMAPAAKIILVEACSNSFSDLFLAEAYATQLVIADGGGDISNSWGGAEFSGETADDTYFYYRPPPGGPYNMNIVYFASAGDSGCGAAYPSSSPWVVSAGGTSLNRNSAHHFTSESCWSGSGGGTSSQETYATGFSGGHMGPWANYQYPNFGAANRATPDMSFDADPDTGVNIYSEYGAGGWEVVGGTSVASPSLAGIVNLAANKLGSFNYENGYISDGFYNSEEDNLLYSQLGAATAYSKNFYDITAGTNGCSVAPNWDYCTGVGSPRGLLGK